MLIFVEVGLVVIRYPINMLNNNDFIKRHQNIDIDRQAVRVKRSIKEPS